MAGGVVFITLLMLSGKGIGKKIRYLIGGTLVLAIIWLVMPEENKGRFRTIWKPEEGPANAQVSAQGRVEGFKAGMEMFRRYPMTGVGIGNYRTYRVQYLDGVPLEPHNFVGQLLGETGLIGGITFLLFVGAILGNCRNITVIGKNHSDVIILFFMDMAKACFHSLILLIFLGMFGHTLYRFQWLWIGAFALLALRFTRERLRVLEQESDFNCMV